MPFRRLATTRLCLSLVLAFCAAPLAAQMTGTWSGTYTLTQDACPGTFHGPATLYATQNGSAFTAVVDIEMKFFDQCTVVTERLILPASGSVSGDTFSGMIFAPLSDRQSIPFTGTMAGNTWTAVATPPQQTITFSLLRSSSTPPDVTLSGTYEGRYSVTDPLRDYPCANVPALFYSGPLKATLFQADEVISGILELRDRKDTDHDPSGNCSIIDKPDKRVGFMGTLAGSTIDGAYFTEHEMFPMTATVSGGATIAGTGIAKDSATFTFSLTRSSSNPAPFVLEFAANPSIVRTGETTTVRWTVFNAVTVTIDQGIGTKPAAGSASVRPSSTTTYTLTAVAANGATATAQTTVHVATTEAPVIFSFTATPGTITAGACSTLAWTTANATTVAIDNGIGTWPVNGSVVVCPSVTTPYTLTATGEGGAATGSTTVVVTHARRRAVRH